MHLYKNAWFDKFARKENITDKALCEAVRQADQGLVEADLGQGLIKQRIARKGAGKSGGYRTIIIYKTKDRALFVYGFAKNDKGNLTPDETVFYRKLAKEYLSLSEDQFRQVAKSRQWKEVDCDDEDL